MKKIDYPKIKFKNKDYYRVGCSHCRSNGLETSGWKVYSDKKSFIVQCVYCDHIEEVEPTKLYDVEQ